MFGALAELLAERANFADKHCVDSLREGTPLFGTLPAAACAEPHDCETEVPLWSLRQATKQHNEDLVRSLKVDKHADFLMQQTLDDHQKGRVAAPVPVSEFDLNEVLLGRRFSREQVLTKEGKMWLGRGLRTRWGTRQTHCTKQARPE